jgi:hypothetical protein
MRFTKVMSMNYVKIPVECTSVDNDGNASKSLYINLCGFSHITESEDGDTLTLWMGDKPMIDIFDDAIALVLKAIAHR